MKALLTACNVGTHNNENDRLRELAEIVHETFPGCESSTRREWILSRAATGSDSRSFVETLRDAEASLTARDGARERVDAVLWKGPTSRCFDMYTRPARLKSRVDSGVVGW
jgi:hypothetical protein